jgi:hypothetical protein
MSPTVVLFIFLGTPLTALGLLEAQSRLERWTERRHSQD